jgi:hypothetical protein
VIRPSGSVSRIRLGWTERIDILTVEGASLAKVKQSSKTRPRGLFKKEVAKSFHKHSARRHDQLSLLLA